MRTSPALLLAAAALMAVAAPEPAFATPTFPFDIESDLSLSYVPPCTVCHAGTPSVNTATTPFAESMKARGLIPNDDASVGAALTRMASDRVDSDMNGQSDDDQLKAGCDPSTDIAIQPGASCSGGTTDLGPSTTYGCGAQVARGQGAPWQGAALLLAGFAAVLARRMARARRARA
jgi:hypothetical protein